MISYNRHKLRKFISLFVSVLLFYKSSSAQSTSRTTLLYLGNTPVKILTTCFIPCSSRVLFLNLHSNEKTSVKAASALLKSIGGTMVRIENGRHRNLSFRLHHKTYVFDPNRIFTTKGIHSSLKKFSTYNKEGERSVQSYAVAILRRVNAADLVVALHNNTNGHFSILSYTKGHKQSRNVYRVYINPGMDVDDFIFTTSNRLYTMLKRKKINVVLQNNSHAYNDGSLSVYEGRRGKTYLNIESQRWHYQQQYRMLAALKQIIRAYR